METQELINTLRFEGADCLHKHYSMGMWKICAEAADEIERLQAALKAAEAIPSRMPAR